MTTRKYLGTALSLALLVAGSAKANTITVADVSNAAGVFTWSASASNSQLVNDGGVGNPGSTYIVIYDFQGYVAGSATQTSPNWTFVGTFATGPVPPATAAPDTGILNLVWRYTGATTTLIDPVTQVSQGTFSATSTILTGTTFGWYATADHDYNGGAANPPASGSVGRVNTPNVPDGGLTASLLGLSMLGLSWARRFVKRA